MRSLDQLSPALERVIARFEGLVRQVGLRHDLAAADLDEVIQDVRIRLWQALDSAERIEAAPSSYVYRTAVSAALDLIRRRRAGGVKVPISEQLAGSREANPETSLSRAELGEQLEGAVGTLSESRRPVVRMYLAGYGREEIADLLGWTEAKTRNLLYRGLSDLRQELARRGVSTTGSVQA